MTHRRISRITCAAALVICTSLPVRAEYMFWTEMFENAIRRAPLDGSQIETIYWQPSFIPYGIAVDTRSDSLYWSGDYSIFRANLDGSATETLINPGNVRELELNTLTDRMYWANPGFTSIQRSDLDGGNIETLTHDTNFPTGLALDFSSEQMYWINEGGPNTISKANFDGSDVQCLIGAHLACVVQATLAGPKSLEIDVPGARLYWTDSVDGSIFSANLNGTDMQSFKTGLTFPWALDYEPQSGMLYWSDALGGGTWGLYRANLDGTDTELILRTDGFVSSLSVMPEPGVVALILPVILWGGFRPGRRVRRVGLWEVQRTGFLFRSHAPTRS